MCLFPTGSVQRLFRFIVCSKFGGRFFVAGVSSVRAGKSYSLYLRLCIWINHPAVLCQVFDLDHPIRYVSGEFETEIEVILGHRADLAAETHVLASPRSTTGSEHQLSCCESQRLLLG